MKLTNFLLAVRPAIALALIGLPLSACGGVKKAEEEWKAQRIMAESACAQIGLPENSVEVAACAAKMQMRIADKGQSP